MMPYKSGASNGAKNVDAFNSKSTESGFVNDAAEAPLNIIKFLRGNSKKQKALEAVKKEAGGY